MLFQVYHVTYHAVVNLQSLKAVIKIQSSLRYIFCALFCVAILYYVFNSICCQDFFTVRLQSVASQVAVLSVQFHLLPALAGALLPGFFGCRRINFMISSAN